MAFRVIWEISYYVPTIHIVGDHYRSQNRCPQNAIMNVCREARDSVLYHQPDYFIDYRNVEWNKVWDFLESANLELNRSRTSLVRNYFTPELDTFWVIRHQIKTNPSPILDADHDCIWRCGICNEEQPNKTWQECIGKFEDWIFPNDEYNDRMNMGSAKLASLLGVEEVLLVVRSFGDFRRGKDIVLDIVFSKVLLEIVSRFYHVLLPSPGYRPHLYKASCSPHLNNKLLTLNQYFNSLLPT